MKEFDFTVRLQFDEDITKISQLTEIAQNISSALMFHINNVDQLCPSANACVEEMKVWHSLSKTITEEHIRPRDIEKILTGKEAQAYHKNICFELIANENQTLETPMKYANHNTSGWWETKSCWVAYRYIDGNMKIEEFTNIDEAKKYAHGLPARNSDGVTL